MRIRYHLLLWLIVLATLFPWNALGQELRAARVLAQYPCDSALFMQGLELLDGRLIVSSGLYGQSLIGEIDLPTGRLKKAVNLEDSHFAEGLTVAEAGIWQVTWREGLAFLRDRQSLRELKRVRYEGEGWGLCFDGQVLYMSDGSATLTLRDPNTFEVKGKLEVRDKGQPVFRLNELEYALGHIFANVWMEDIILKIDPASGEAVYAYDLSALKALAFGEKAAPDGNSVLNGIAHVREDLFYIGGKNWPLLFMVQLP
jgi:glutamine cyclotransferase